MLILGFVLSVMAGVVGTILCRVITQMRENRPLKRLLNFGHDELVFVYSRRDDIPAAVLPRTSTEDFLAINNAISALLKISWKQPVGVRSVGAGVADDGRQLSPNDRERNLVTICSPKSNPFTRELLEELKGQGSDIFQFEKVEGKEEWQIVDGAACYRSSSYKQIADYQKEGKRVEEQRINDVAMVAKVTNPWNARNKIIIIAGIRGIGTWGVAECLKKQWQQIYELKHQSKHFRKSGDFAAIVEVEYENCDIVRTRVDTLRDFS